MIIKKCNFCGKEFNPPKSRYLFCSRSCANKNLRKIGILKPKPKEGIFKTCQVCGKTFYVIKCREKTAIYCSRNCLAKKHLAKYIPIYGFQKLYRPIRRYKYIKLPDGRQIRKHRWLMEKHLGRKLLPTEHVHHIDGNYLNNSLKNLIVLSHSQHSYLEVKLKKVTF